MTGYLRAHDARFGLVPHNKWLLAFALLAGVFLFAGCGDDGPAADTTQPHDARTTARSADGRYRHRGA